MGLLTRDERRRLVDLLGSLPNIGQPGVRQLLLMDLPRQLQDSIEFSSYPTVHISNIVSTVDSDAWRQLSDGSWPLKIVIENAMPLLQGALLGDELQMLLDTVEARTSTVNAARTPSPAQSAATEPSTNASPLPSSGSAMDSPPPSFRPQLSAAEKRVKPTPTVSLSPRILIGLGIALVTSVLLIGFVWNGLRSPDHTSPSPTSVPSSNSAAPTDTRLPDTTPVSAVSTVAPNSSLVTGLPAIVPTPIGASRLFFYNQSNGLAGIAILGESGDLSSLQYIRDFFSPGYVHISFSSNSRVLCYPVGAYVALTSRLDISSNFSGLQYLRGLANDWTTIAALDDRILLFYSRVRGVGATGQINDDGSYHSLEDPIPAPKLNERGLTHGVALDHKRVFWYNRDAGLGMVAHVDNSGHYELLHDHVDVTPDMSQVVAFGSLLLLYRPGTVITARVNADNSYTELQTYKGSSFSSPEWTNITAAANGVLLFYNQQNGHSTTARVDSDGHILSLRPLNDLDSDWTHIVRIP